MAYDPFFNPGGDEPQDMQEVLYDLFLRRQGGFRGTRGTGTDIVGPGGAAFGSLTDVLKIPGGGLISGFLPNFGVRHRTEYRNRYIDVPAPAGPGEPVYTDPIMPRDERTRRNKYLREERGRHRGGNYNDWDWDEPWGGGDPNYMGRRNPAKGKNPWGPGGPIGPGGVPNPRAGG